MIVMDLVAPLIQAPRALRDGNPMDVLRLACGTFVAVRVGALVPSMAAPELFRRGVSAVALGLPVLLAAGIRHRGKPSPRLACGAGLPGGFTGGSAGLPGPPVLLLYMASSLPAATVRANVTLYRMLADPAIPGRKLYYLSYCYKAPRNDFSWTFSAGSSHFQPDAGSCSRHVSNDFPRGKPLVAMRSR